MLLKPYRFELETKAPHAPIDDDEWVYRTFKIYV